MTKRPSADAAIRALEVVGRLEFTIRGCSMRPFVPEGARIVCRRPRPDESLLHRIVVAHHGGRQLAHRVVMNWVDHDGARWIRMRGDNSVGCEDVRRDDVVAVADELVLGATKVPLHRVPARLEGGLAWIGRQVLLFPRRVDRVRARRMLAA